MSRATGHSALRSLTALATILVVVVVVVIMLRGCMSGHSRANGQGDVRMGISPDGSMLVFSAAGKGGSDLYLLDLRSLRVDQIAATAEYEIDPKFSPDGRSIVFGAGRPGDPADHIFIRRLNEPAIAQLTFEDANDASPAFSPDGSLIVFTRDKTYNWGGLAANWDAGGTICVIGADGAGLREIRADPLVAVDPQFSPDGKRILFWSDNSLYTVAADGHEPPRPLAGLQGIQAVYSPRAGLIAFSRGTYQPSYRIFTAREDGTEVKQLACLAAPRAESPGGGCFRPCFTPDGKRILFLLELWPDGARGQPKKSLWEVDVAACKAHEIASFMLFEDPLSWSPAVALPPKR